MRIAVFGLTLLGLVACSKQRPAEAPRSTTITSAQWPASAGMQRAENVRAVLRRQQVASHADLDALVIIDSDGVVTLAGDVSDERARTAIADAVRNIEGVREVRDVMRVKPQVPEP